MQKHQCSECRRTKHPSEKGWIPTRPWHSRKEVEGAAALVLDLLSAADTLVLSTQTLGSLVVFRVALSNVTEVPLTLHPFAVFECDLILNRYNIQEFNMCLWKILKPFSFLTYLCVHKKTHFLCKYMIMSFYV